MKNVAIIGAGAAGLMAAYAASIGGNSVTVFEKNEKCGKKIYLTGKGRCNLTNDCEPYEFLKSVVSNAKFLTSAIHVFSPQDAKNFFESGGLRLKSERGNRVFPVTDKASAVTKCLEKYCISAGVAFRFNENVLKISHIHSTMFNIITVNNEYSFDCVVICTGGVSYPTTGSTGDGYEFAKSLGHKIVDVKSSLCGLNLKGNYYKELQGLGLKNVNLSLFFDGKKQKDFFGELLFTHFGISGPIALSLSSYMNRLDLNRVRLCLDLKPALSHEQLDLRILRDFDKYKNKDITNCLKELLPSALISVVLERCNIQLAKKINSITKKERLSLLTTVKSFDMIVSSLRGFDEAIVTAGGVDVKDVNPQTMESKIVKGLYFCGEVLDLDALTGGFNMQIAFSTGYVAGSSIK